MDFSPDGEAALRYADKLARIFGASVTVINVAEVNDGWSRLGAKQFQVLDEELTENHRRFLASMVRRSGVSNPEAYIVKIGSPVEQIVKAAREIQADLIVIGTRGRTGLKHAFIGSTAEGVVRQAHCPVWVVPKAVRT